MKRPRSGIIGTGFIGAVHARAVRAAGGVVSAVAGSSRTRAQAMATTMGASRVSESAAALIESDDVDIIHTRGGPSRAFADIGIHWVDLVEFVSGHRITRLCARAVTVHAERGTLPRVAAAGTEDAAAVLFETDGGAVGTLLASQVSPGRKNRLGFSLDGTDKSVSFNQEQQDVLWVGTPSGTWIVPRGGLGSASEADPWNVDWQVIR
jgi:predicted dehydrogenase